MQAYADALLVIPKVLSQNAGFDAQDTIVKLQQAHQTTGEFVGVDLSTGEAIIPDDEGIFDNYRVKRHIIHSAYVPMLSLWHY
jgi:T-complex protein 1 subunit zeta